MDNEAAFQICRSRLGIERPGYPDLNRMVAQVVSSLTASLRFRGALNVDLSEYQVNLVPFPRLRFAQTSYAPFVSAASAKMERHPVSDLTRSCFDPGHQMVGCDPRAGKYLSCCLLYRGDVVARDIHQAVSVS